MYVSQTHIPSAEPIRQSFVVDSHQVQHCGVQVVDFCAVLDGLVAEFISCTVNRAASDSRSGHPQRKTKRIVITTVASLGEGVLPNSPDQTTSVWFSRPRCLRSVSRAEMGLSTERAFFVCPSTRLLC